MTAPGVVIVGAGPAGARAAQTLVAAGLRPIVVDEGARAGGQIYRRPPQPLARPAATLYGSEARKARALHADFDAMAERGAIAYLRETSVLTVHDGRAQVLGPQGLRWLAFDKLILATGAIDRLAPVPGWESAGVYTLGAMQIALKAQGAAMGRRVALAGSGPLLTLLATQLLKAGAHVAAVLDTAPLGVQARAFPALAAARPLVALRGAAMRARLGRLYSAGVALERIEADQNGPVTIVWRDSRGRDRRTDCDAVGLGWHLRAETRLADLAGCAFDYDATWRQWLPRVDAFGRAGENLYLAGDGVRLNGADGAEIAGRLAAAACLTDLRLPAPPTTDLLRRHAEMARFAAALARAFPWPTEAVRGLPDEAVLCRCEGVTAGEARAAAACGGQEANRTKSLARVGMGRCQGRYCDLALAEILGAGEAAAAGRLRAQAPVRPVPASAYMAADEATLTPRLKWPGTPPADGRA